MQTRNSFKRYRENEKSEGRKRPLRCRTQAPVQGYCLSSETTSQQFDVSATTPCGAEHKDTPGRGLFLALPAEILHSLFGLLDLSSLGQLALASKGLNQAVEEYIYTSSGHRHVIPAPPSGYGDIVNSLDFRNLGERSPLSLRYKKYWVRYLGLLLKRVTAMRSLKYQLKTASFYLNKVIHVFSIWLFCSLFNI